MTRHTGRTVVFSRRSVIAGSAVLPFAVAAQPPAMTPERTLRITSPNGRVTGALFVHGDPSRPPSWSADHDGHAVIEESSLGLILADGGLLGPHARFVSASRSALRGHWAPPYGIAARYDESQNRLEAVFEDRRRGISFAIVLAAHDDGIAVRYRLLDAPGHRVALGGEATCLRMPAGTTLWSSRDEGDYAISTPGRINPVPHPDPTRSTDPGPLADTPLTAMTATGLALAIGESDRLHYPRLMFRPGPDADSIMTHLMRFPGRATGPVGPGDTHAAPTFSVDTPFDTPWRVVTIAPTPVALIAKAGLTATLATPNQLGDMRWIRPGRAFRIRAPYTTERAIACIDFAVRRKVEFVEFDWRWYGDGTDASDATVPIPAIDMPAVLAYAKTRQIGMILYVDRTPAMRQLDAIVKTYRAWGIAAIKFGFIWEGRQEDVDFIHATLKTCGDHQLMVCLHDNVRPAGLERTLPNYIAMEGVRGNEQFPTARHNVTLPFTRALAGPIDYTICYAHERNRTTNAHQLAMAAVYYNPLTFLYWYDEPAKYDVGDWPELHWFDECPTTWDETVALSGAIGEHVAVARRSGRRWFLGAMTNEVGRTLRLPLDFLGAGRWDALIHGDGPPAPPANATKVVITRRRVAAGETLDLTLAPSGGQAILFTPA